MNHAGEPAHSAAVGQSSTTVDGCPVFLVHISHAAMAARDSALFLFRNVGDEGLGGQHQRSDGASIGKSSAYDLRRIEHASLN
jgi:hypothetical protein